MAFVCVVVFTLMLPCASNNTVCFVCHVTCLSHTYATSCLRPHPCCLLACPGPAPVYIGFGSLVVDDPAKLTAQFVEALKRTGLRAIIQRGWGEWTGLGRTCGCGGPTYGLWHNTVCCRRAWCMIIQYPDMVQVGHCSIGMGDSSIGMGDSSIEGRAGQSVS